MVSNCPKCQMVLGVKLSAASNGPRILYISEFHAFEVIPIYRRCPPPRWHWPRCGEIEELASLLFHHCYWIQCVEYISVVMLDFKFQHFPVRELAGSDRSKTMPDRIQLKQIAPTLNTTIMNENLGWVPNLNSVFYFVQKLRSLIHKGNRPLQDFGGKVFVPTSFLCF